MADTFTSNYSWTLPEVGASSSTWGTKLNANLTDIDLKVKANATAASAAQSAADAAQTTANAAQTTANAAMPKAGGTFTGAVALAAAPTADLHPATKKYVDDLIATLTAQIAALTTTVNGKFDKTGGAISGSIAVTGNITATGNITGYVP